MVFSKAENIIERRLAIDGDNGDVNVSLDNFLDLKSIGIVGIDVKISFEKISLHDRLKRAVDFGREDHRERNDEIGYFVFKLFISGEQEPKVAILCARQDSLDISIEIIEVGALCLDLLQLLNEVDGCENNR